MLLLLLPTDCYYCCRLLSNCLCHHCWGMVGLVWIHSSSFSSWCLPVLVHCLSFPPSRRWVSRQNKEIFCPSYRPQRLSTYLLLHSYLADGRHLDQTDRQTDTSSCFILLSWLYLEHYVNISTYKGVSMKLFYIQRSSYKTVLHTKEFVQNFSTYKGVRTKLFYIQRSSYKTFPHTKEFVRNFSTYIGVCT